jgi:hypothetical protein
LCNSVISSESELEAIYDKLRHESNYMSLSSSFLVTNIDIVHAISALKVGKSDGDYNLSSDYFINGSPELHVHLALLINSIFVHGFVPDDFRISSIIPIPKGKSNICDSNNYRFITLSSILAKLLIVFC